MLWIAFRLYLWHWNHNSDLICRQSYSVVNCFQIVSLTLEPQRIHKNTSRGIRCELLSDCIFDIGTTTFPFSLTQTVSLWIAFRLYLWHWNHNYPFKIRTTCKVVNCFQIVSLTLELQPSLKSSASWDCCELLSDCIFDIGTTTNSLYLPWSKSLWIAFRLYLWHWNHNRRLTQKTTVRVVNCFQIVSLTLEPQLSEIHQDWQISCELLSDCIFDIGTTTAPDSYHPVALLWIAFRLYLWHWNHNKEESCL